MFSWATTRSQYEGSRLDEVFENFLKMRSFQIATNHVKQATVLGGQATFQPIGNWCNVVSAANTPALQQLKRVWELLQLSPSNFQNALPAILSMLRDCKDYEEPGPTVWGEGVWTKMCELLQPKLATARSPQGTSPTSNPPTVFYMEKFTMECLCEHSSRVKGTGMTVEKLLSLEDGGGIGWYRVT